MIDNLTITSGVFILILIIAPCLRINSSSRKYLFLIVNIFLYTICLEGIIPFLAILIFINIPYVYMLLVRKYRLPLFPIITLLLIMFIYMKGYIWIVKPVIGNDLLFLYKLLGLSYIFFKIIDILIHVNAGLIGQLEYINYINYLFSFWTIMAGPIQRYNEFINSFNANIQEITQEESLKYLHRAANGFIKILLLSVFFKNIADSRYDISLIEGFTKSRFLSIYYCIPLYLYFNFSGYCDVVIAMAKWAGFDIPENFDKPYLSRDMIDFWNRWHITMSQFLRDYVYQPLFKYYITHFLPKNVGIAQYVSIFVTFFLAGLWHGVTINFLIFGLLQGLGMSFSMIYRYSIRKYLGKLKYEKYVNNQKIVLIETFVCLHFICYTALYYAYDVKTIFLAQLKILHILY
ncbi:membrane bound O-acyl transferase MBOAT family protein [Candidatus Magnetobacterium bavaricum]|uniref:Membrane bound O-acyl transferase MBOAT family protein n=1 Tax=Candidatus Magnetobacterium bavaricum TaxID=29290 RepID=A0A0F3GXA0_9BACT|nr:membrane bound O-acyl transferase MBOAT family protein [Candidatus Magnetobacterium bavaricum]